MTTDKNPLLLHTNLAAGRGGQSGRVWAFKEVAMEYAFMLDLAGKVKVKGWRDFGFTISDLRLGAILEQQLGIAPFFEIAFSNYKSGCNYLSFEKISGQSQGCTLILLDEVAT